MYPKNYDPEMFVSKPGERFKPEYIGEPDENGVIQLVKVGETDLIELHQRDAFANDVNFLYERFCNGDVTALSQVQGTFLDSLGLPRDLRGMYDMISAYQTVYDNLPEDMRSKYSFESWLENAGSEMWMKDFVPSSPADNTPKSELGEEVAS